MKHFAHYIKRTIVDASKQSGEESLPYVEYQPPDQGFKIPTYHSVAANSGVARRVSAGDTIWLFSQLSSPWGSLKPSLDAKIIVSEVEKDQSKSKGRYRFTATQDSKWYPLFDASDLIHELVAIDAHRKPRALLNTNTTAIGQALQFLREIQDPTPIVHHANIVSEALPDFISYRINDGTASAFALAKLLIDHKRAVFWDRWSLPRRLAERGLDVGDEPLDCHVYHAIETSRIVWGVASDLYAVHGSYSKKEQELATKLGKFRKYPPWVNG
jgi:hypothetical protein